MTSSDRRRDPRVNACVVMRFRVLNNPKSPEFTAESENMSQRGIYFLSSAPLEIGMPMELSLRIPHDLAEKVTSEVTCMGRVVHVRPISGKEGVSGIGLHIERFEARTPEQERRAS